MKRTLLYSFLTLVALLLVASHASAQDASWLSLVPAEKTVTEHFLDMIFQGGTITSQKDGLFPSMSRVLNTAVLMFIVGAVALGGVGYAIHSANKGSLGGGKISSLMTPLRLGLIIPLLTPLPSGYSASQYLINSVGRAAVFPATETAKIGAKYIEEKGSPQPLVMNNTIELVRHAITSELCRAYFKDVHDADKLEPVYQGGSQTRNYTVLYHWPGKKTKTVENFCGEFKVSKRLRLSLAADQKKASDDYYAAEIAALRQLLAGAETLVGEAVWLAGETVKANKQRVRDANAGMPVEYDLEELPDMALKVINGIESLKTAYDQQMNTAAVEFVKTVQTSEGQKSWSQEIEEKDFAVVGMYYFSQLKYQEFVKSAFQSNTTSSLPELKSGKRDFTKTIEKAGNELSDAIDVINSAFQSVAQTTSGLGTIEATEYSIKPKFSIDTIAALSNAIIAWMHNGIINVVFQTDDGSGGKRNYDLVIVMQSFGSWIVSALDVVMLGALALYILGYAAADGVNQSVIAWFGGGAAGGAIKGVLEFSMKFLFPLIIYLIALGFFLGYWIPAIPIITWILAYFGWLIIFFSALIIIPMWLATLAIATDDTWMTTHQRQGWVLIFGLFARPTIMVMTFFGVYVLMEIAGWLFQWFARFVVTLGFGGFTGLFGWAFMITIVCIVAYNLVTRVFSLVPEMGDRIMRGLNAGQETFGEQQTEVQGRGAAMGAGRAMSKGIAGGFVEDEDKNKKGN